MRRAFGAFFVWCASCASSAPITPLEPEGTTQAVLVERGDDLRRAGSWDAAGAAYRAALKAEPMQRRAHMGVQEVYRKQGRELEVREMYRLLDDPYLLSRVEGDPVHMRRNALRAPEPFLSRGRARVALLEGKVEEAERHYRRACALDPGDALNWIGWGRMLHARGRFGEARAAFETAVSVAPGHPSGWYGLSLCAQRLGEDELAWEAARRAFVGAPGDEQATRRLVGASGTDARKQRAARLLGSGGVRAQLEAAELWDELGEPERATVAIERARALGATEGERAAARPQRHDPRMERFISRLRRGMEARYRHFRATKESEDLESLRGWVRALYEECLKTKLEAPGPIESWSFVGALVDPTIESREPVVRALADRGLLLILGQRAGGPAEAMLGDVVRREGPAKVASRGVTVEREAVWLGKRHLSGYVEWLGGGDVAGLALGRLILVDLPAAAKWEGELRRRRAALEPYRAAIARQQALPDQPLDAVDDPAGVAERLLFDTELDVAAEVLVHEDAHLVDAKRYLPEDGKRLWAGVGLAWRRGLSATNVMAYLERNAQLAAIAEGRTPRAALAVCCASLGGAGVHAQGYREIVQEFVRRILADPARYPAIDSQRLVVQQLDKLDADQIRTLAISIQRDWAGD